MGIWYSEGISNVNRETLFDYYDFLRARKLSLPRQEKLMKAMKRLGELLGKKTFKA